MTTIRDKENELFEKWQKKYESGGQSKACPKTEVS